MSLPGVKTGIRADLDELANNLRVACVDRLAQRDAIISANSPAGIDQQLYELFVVIRGRIGECGITFFVAPA